MKLLLAWLVVGSAATFLLFGWDKHRARAGGRRVPEARLLLMAGLTGCVGAWLGMLAFRHKSAKRSFQGKLIAVTAADTAVLVLVVALGR